jgi:putative endonuclease
LKLVRTTTDKGRLAEDKALEFLISEGLVTLARNYRSRQGEIDLIMQDKDTTVFVEVRARTNNKVLHAIETIDQRKQSHIIRTSQHYLQHDKKNQTHYYRFDVICMNGPIDKANIEWIKNAFDA